MDKIIVFIKKHNVAIISTIVFWLFAEVFLIAPIASTIVDSSVSGTFNLTYFMENVVNSIVTVNGIKKVFIANYIGTFFKSTLFFTIIFGIALGIGLYKGRKRGKYDKIEHGSSDWCQGGEQYRILSKNNGIILAEDNYLPLDKIGNINTLIVRRFWFW